MGRQRGTVRGGGDRRRERWRGYRTVGILEFLDERQTTRGELLFIGSKISAAVQN
jgi:hypothetical protein